MYTSMYALDDSARPDAERPPAPSVNTVSSLTSLTCSSSKRSHLRSFGSADGRTNDQ